MYADAVSTNIVVTAVRHQNVIEISQTDGTVVFEHFPFIASLFIPSSRVVVPALDVSLAVLGLNSHLVSPFQLF